MCRPPQESRLRETEGRGPPGPLTPLRGRPNDGRLVMAPVYGGPPHLNWLGRAVRPPSMLGAPVGSCALLDAARSDDASSSRRWRFVVLSIGSFTRLSSWSLPEAPTECYLARRSFGGDPHSGNRAAQLPYRGQSLNRLFAG